MGEGRGVTGREQEEDRGRQRRREETRGEEGERERERGDEKGGAGRGERRGSPG